MIKQRSFLTYMLLLIITCGIYGIFFWYKYAKDINTVCEGDEQESPNYIIVILLSIITFDIYGLYWIYKQGKRLSEIAPKYSLNFSETGSTVLLWSTFGALLCGIGPIFAQYILVKNLNSVAIEYSKD